MNKSAARKLVFAALAAVGITYGNTAQSATLDGTSVTAFPWFPNIGTYGGVGHSVSAVVDPGVEFADGSLLYGAQVDIADTRIIFTSFIDTTYLTATFNGIELDFSGAPPITNVILDPLSTIGVTSISWTTDKIFLDSSGQTVSFNGQAVFDVNSTPLPGTLPLFATSVGAALCLLSSRRTKKKIAAI